jgi:ubiquinone/menaquinone biosynthesis C-methylase UbiE
LVRQLAGSQSEATFVHVGERLLKGFDQPTDVYALEPRQELQGSVFSEPGRHEDIGEQLVAVMDFWGSLPSMQRVRTAASAQLAALPGDVICDIGCGPGTELVRVARVVGPGGVAIGVDPSAAMLEEARRRADGANVTVELHQRDGRDTGLAAGRCDGVRMERVIQHVGDIDGLVAEAVRITRPGGRIVLVDSDWGSLMVYPGNRVLVDRVSGVFASKILPEAWAGRRLHDALLRHHLTDVRSTIYPIQADGGVLRTLGVMYQRYVGSELMSRAQADEHLAELSSPSPCSSHPGGFPRHRCAQTPADGDRRLATSGTCDLAEVPSASSARWPGQRGERGALIDRRFRTARSTSRIRTTDGEQQGRG